MPKTIQLTETAALTQADVNAMTSGRMVIQAISAGVGSSGYYSPAVLEQAATDRLITRGTALHLDHPTETEQFDRPERSVSTIAGVFTGDAHWDPAREALVGEVQIFQPYRDRLAEMAPYIGLSIRGTATNISEGEVDGRKVPCIEGMHSIDSVDFVTKAGRGGKVLSLIESARTVIEDAFTPTASLVRLMESRNVGQWIESRMHLDFTQQADDMFGQGRLSREERIAMSGAVGSALDAFTASLEASAPQLYERDLWEDPVEIATAIEAAMTEAGLPPAFVTDKAKCATCDHPGAKHADMGAKKPNAGACSMAGCDCKAMKMPAAKEAATQTPVVPAGNEKEITMPQIEEARLSQLEADSGRVPVLEAERTTAVEALTAMTTERDTARTELAQFRAQALARPIAARLIGESTTLPAVIATRVIEAAVASVTLTEAGVLDEAAFTTLTEAAKVLAETEVAAIAEAMGAGKITGFGHTTSPEVGISEAERDALYATAFNRPVKEA